MYFIVITISLNAFIIDMKFINANGMCSPAFRFHIVLIDIKSDLQRTFACVSSRA